MSGDRLDELSEGEAQQRLSELSDVSRETLQRLNRFEDLLRHWNRAINLVAPRELDRLWSRHILDSLGLAPHLPEAGLWMDVGSGGGFPAIPLAIVSRETRPELKFKLVESDQRKCAFLREAARALELNVVVEARRVETLASENPRIISARALSGLKNILSYTENHRAGGAKMVLLKGEKAHDELTAASAEWHMRYQAERHPLTRNGYILIIREAKRGKFR